MTFSNFLTAIKSEVSPNAKILFDPSNEEFKAALQRWSDLNVQAPGAIVLVATEDDIVKTVRPSMYISRIDNRSQF